jgi:hypothetical protein
MRKDLPIILLGIVLVVLVAISCYTDPHYQDKQNSADASAPPSTFQNSTTPSAQEAQVSKHVPVWRELIAWPEGVTTLAILLTLFFIAWQALLMRQAGSASEEASKRELRAYLTVVIGQATYQERRSEEKGGDLMFDARPLLINTGQTPARKIIFKVRAAIMPMPMKTFLAKATSLDSVSTSIGI